jgi:hypothetical protein
MGEQLRRLVRRLPVAFGSSEATPGTRSNQLVSMEPCAQDAACPFKIVRSRPRQRNPAGGGGERPTATPSRESDWRAMVGDVPTPSRKVPALSAWWSSPRKPRARTPRARRGRDTWSTTKQGGGAVRRRRAGVGRRLADEPADSSAGLRARHCLLARRFASEVTSGLLVNGGRKRHQWPFIIGARRHGHGTQRADVLCLQPTHLSPPLGRPFARSRGDRTRSWPPECRASRFGRGASRSLRTSTHPESDICARCGSPTSTRPVRRRAHRCEYSILSLRPRCVQAPRLERCQILFLKLLTYARTWPRFDFDMATIAHADPPTAAGHPQAVFYVVNRLWEREPVHEEPEPRLSPPSPPPPPPPPITAAPPPRAPPTRPHATPATTPSLRLGRTPKTCRSAPDDLRVSSSSLPRGPPASPRRAWSAPTSSAACGLSR